MKSEIELLKEEIDQRKKILQSLSVLLTRHQDKVEELEKKVYQLENEVVDILSTTESCV